MKETDNYKDTIDVSDAPRHPNATYYGKAKVFNARGELETMYGMEGRAWRGREFPEKWLFLPKEKPRKDEYIFLVSDESLVFNNFPKK